MLPTTNANVFSQHRMDVKPNMSDWITSTIAYNSAFTKARDNERGNVPAIDSKTLIYDQSRIVSPTNYYGTRFIRYIDPTRKINPAGIDGRNSTRATGEAFTKPVKPQYPQFL